MTRIGSSSSFNFNPIDIAISGMRGQGKRMEDISTNVANVSTTVRKPGQPGAAGGKGGISLDDLPAQMMSLNTASRGYRANVAILRRYEDMMETTLELLR